MLAVRSALFYFGYIIATTWFGVTGMVIFRWLPYPVRSQYLLMWNRFTLVWLRLCCGVRYQVIGRHNIPDSPVVVLSKHESQWETYYLQLALHPIATILKKELLDLPGFGWGLRLMQPIPIDRSSPREAIRQMMTLGAERLAGGLSVLVFPEGTRTPPGQSGKYARGGANLAIKAGVPVVAIAHNAGICWPSRQWIKQPGTITVCISEPIPTADRSAADITDQARSWIEAQIATMPTGNNLMSGHIG
jgi:1-acyl-sn-glycerol-3-phosphate acyltransferase